jgi:hypothetical protein
MAPPRQSIKILRIIVAGGGTPWARQGFLDAICRARARKADKPTGFAEHPAHVSSVGMWPRSDAERHYNVVWWSNAGGRRPLSGR